MARHVWNWNFAGSSHHLGARVWLNGQQIGITCFSIWSLDEEIRWFKCVAIHRQVQEKVVALHDDLSIIIKRIVRSVVVWVVNQI